MGPAGFTPAALLRAADALVLLAGVLAGGPGRAYRELLRALLGRSRGAAGRAYGAFYRALADAGPVSGGDPWRAHLIEGLLEDDGPFARAAQTGGPGLLESPLLQGAAWDLRQLQLLHAAGSAILARWVEEREGKGPGGQSWPVPAGRPGGQERPAPGPAERRLRDALQSAADWGGLAPALAACYREAGSGIFRRYRVLRWRRREGRGGLAGVAHPDPVTLADLIGHKAERELVLRNTARLAAGLPAHHVLLTGDRGTGKSATVKALPWAFADRGLRLVELGREDLGDLPEVLALLRPRPFPFVLFVDDLSFEQGEAAYKSLKAVLEGSAEAPPRNVRLYVTSNRRHLVEELFSERTRQGPSPGDGRVHPMDAVQEKLSLADRFGLSVTFAAPDPEGFLRVVEGLARRRGLDLPAAELRRRALAWVNWRSGRSGRAARQFVDELEAVLAEEAAPLPPARDGSGGRQGRPGDPAG